MRTIAMQDGATQTKRPCDAPAGSSPSSAENKVRQMVMEKLKGANAQDWSKEKIAGYLAEQLETFRASIGENVTDTQPPADMALRARGHIGLEFEGYGGLGERAQGRAR